MLQLQMTLKPRCLPQQQFVVFAHMCLHSRNPEWKSGPNWDMTGLVAERIERCVTTPWLLKFPLISDIWIFLFTFNLLKDVSWSSLMMKTGKYNPPTGRGGKHLGTIIQPRVHNVCAQKILHIILDYSYEIICNTVYTYRPIFPPQKIEHRYYILKGITD